MPKREKRTEQEIHDMIVRDAKIRLGCKEFAPEFTLWRVEGDRTNWDVQSATNVDYWKPDCAEAFHEAVARARRKFDIAWP